MTVRVHLDGRRAVCFRDLKPHAVIPNELFYYSKDKHLLPMDDLCPVCFDSPEDGLGAVASTFEALRPNNDNTERQLQFFPG